MANDAEPVIVVAPQRSDATTQFRSSRTGQLGIEKDPSAPLVA